MTCLFRFYCTCVNSRQARITHRPAEKAVFMFLLPTAEKRNKSKQTEPRQVYIIIFYFVDSNEKLTLFIVFLNAIYSHIVGGV